MSYVFLHNKYTLIEKKKLVLTKYQFAGTRGLKDCDLAKVSKKFLLFGALSQYFSMMLNITW